MSLPLSHKTHHNIRKSQPYKKKKYKIYTNYKKQDNTSKPKKDVKCFKCGKKGHIAQNCKKHKIDMLSDNGYHLEDFEESIYSDNSKNYNSEPEKELNSNNKIEKCFRHINMLTTDQEVLIDMIDHIEDKETKAKFIRKIMKKIIQILYHCKILINSNI